MAVPFFELSNSPKETWSKTTFSAQMEVAIPWPQRNTFVIERLATGQAYPHNPTVGAVLQNVVTEPFPDSKTDELAPGLGLTAYVDGLATLTYAIPSGAIGGPIGEVEIIQSIEPSAEFLTLDARLFRWDQEGDEKLEANEAPGKIIQTFDYVISIRGADNVPSSILNKVGKVNAVSIFAVQLGFSFAAETLLFGTPTISQNEGGTLNVVYRFTYREDGWNKYWRVSEEDFVQMFKKDPAVEGEDPTFSIYKNFPLVSFSDIT